MARHHKLHLPGFLHAVWLTLSFVCVLAEIGSAEDLDFNIRLLTVDANEGIVAGDIDRDGKKDLVAGRHWYRGGDWAPRPLRQIDDWNGYVQSNGDFLFDVNGDGWLDVIAGSYLPTEIHWYENPRDEGLRLGQLWEKHLLVDTGHSTNEGQMMHDLDGDGRPEWIVNSWKADTPMMVWRLVDLDAGDDSVGGATVKAIGHQLGNVNGHGQGVGDLNGDGKPDVLVGHGWYEQPAEAPWSSPWTYHADWELHASLPMIVADLDQDGDNDVIFGNGHDFGLYWWRNDGLKEDGGIRWSEHLIDEEYSQPHTLAWVDLDAKKNGGESDGQPELITGKRYFAHNGKDPGGREMPCLYYYRWDQQTEQFTRHTIDEGHVGCGLQIVAEDLNGDGAIDIAVAGKSGTYLLEAK